MKKVACTLKDVIIPEGYVPNNKTQLWAVVVPDVDGGKYDGAGSLEFHAVKNEKHLRQELLKYYLGDEPEFEVNDSTGEKEQHYIAEAFDEDYGYLICPKKIGMYISHVEPKKKRRNRNGKR